MNNTWGTADDTSAAISPKVTLIAYANKGLRANIRVANRAVTALEKGTEHNSRKYSPFTVAFFTQTSDS